MSEWFILRPVATTLLAVATIIIGMIGYYQLPVSSLPNVDLPTIQVTTSYPGASPEVMATAVTAPLENQLGQIAGLVLMNSTSSYGLSQITLQFNLSRKADAASQDVQAAINAAGGWLPTNQLPSPPTYRQVNPADAPVLVLALTSDTLPLHEVNDYAATLLVQKLSQVSGVGAVTIEGAQSRAVRVQVNPTRLAALGLSIDDVRRAIAATTVNNPKGSLDGSSQAFQVGANDQLMTAAAFSTAVVAYRNGAPVMLHEVGTAVDSVENKEQAAWFNGEPAVILNIRRQPGSNTIQVVDAIKTLLPRLKDALPPALKISIIADRTTGIRAAIADVYMTLVTTAALVVLVILVFLRKLWATVIPSVVLPISLIITFAVLAALGFSLNILTLMALTVATGLVVDDAIVMIENIVRHMEAGDGPLEAALKGARQIGFTIISLTMSLIAVFIPLLMMSGVIGRLFREFSIALCVAVIASAVLSLTLTPMMCASLLTGSAIRSRPHPLLVWSERGFEALSRAYARSLDWVLRHQRATLLFTAATMVATVWMYDVVKKGFLPEQDTGLLVAYLECPQGGTFATVTACQRQVADAVAQDRAVRAVGSFVGIGGDNLSLNSGKLYLDIGTRSDRAEGARAIIARLRARAASVADAKVHIKSVQDLEVDARASRTRFQYVLQDIDENRARASALRLSAEMRRQRELENVVTDQEAEGPQAVITVDRTAAARLGVTVNAIDQVLYDSFGQRQIATIYAPLTQYHVILESAGAETGASLQNILDNTYITSASAAAATTADQRSNLTAGFNKASAFIPFSSFARIEYRTAPLVITHQGLFPAATISFDLSPGHSLDGGLRAVQAAKDRAGLPPDVVANLAGTAAEFATAARQQPWLILAAIVSVYIVLGVLYESFIHPLTILSTLPSAGLGTLIALTLFGLDLDVVSFVGIILLIGIVKKNAIMMVDFAIDFERTKGASSTEAIRNACRLRFRPIVMTTMAALLGALPLAFGEGTSSEFRQPLGIAIVGGLLLSQFLTLYTTPAVYLMFARIQDASARRLRALQSASGDVNALRQSR